MRKTLLQLLLIVVTILLLNKFATGLTEHKVTTSTPIPTPFQQRQPHKASKVKKVSYNHDVKPIFDSRCVICHACYDAPCQLKLSSYEGLDRGATKQQVYDPERLENVSPTRLFTDAPNTASWRKKDFFPVLTENIKDLAQDQSHSVLAHLLELKQNYPLINTGKLDASFKLDIERDLQCPTHDEINEYADKHPYWGMPYAMPGISPHESAIINQWLLQGAPIPKQRKAQSKQALTEIRKWEDFFNRPTKKQQLVSRYLFEHLYIGHLHFLNQPDHEFYHLVRSTTPSGVAIKEIPSLLPYDDPGTDRFYYRLRPIVATIVDKNHFVYELSNKRLKRYQELFFQPDYEVKELPSYQIKSAANPFKTFMDIPQKSRYQFLLDDAQYFFSGFIKGPVCRGQVAINVIQDQFWVAFINPEVDFTDPEEDFVSENPDLLEMPGSAGQDIRLYEWYRYGKLANKYLKEKDTFLDKTLLREHSVNLDFIWDGGHNNKNAALTVFRHFNNATVVKGFIGNIPKTGWIVDYPIFERIHYLLVASFNVYGSLSHQVATRTYMDYIRMDAENNFLRFIPAQQRQSLHDDWYQGIGAKLFTYFRKPYFSIEFETGINFQSTDYKRELFSLIRKKLGGAVNAEDTINYCQHEHCVRKNVSSVVNKIDDQVKKIALFRGLETQNLPQVTFLRVETEDPKNDPAYTILVNTALSSLAFMYGENLRRLPNQDSITVIPDLIGSYPNFFFSVKQNQLPEFITLLKTARSEKQKEYLYQTFGVRRTNPKIWPLMDWFNQKHKQQNGLYAGLFDMNRYKNL